MPVYRLVVQAFVTGNLELLNGQGIPQFQHLEVEPFAKENAVMENLDNSMTYACALA